MSIILGLDIGSNSVGSAWIDSASGRVVTGTSIFPAGVDETDEKRGEPKNAKRRMTRRTRITLARRSTRKRQLRQRLIAAGLLPPDEAAFKTLLESTDPLALRRKGLDGPLQPFEFGRLLLHLAQRRGALGLRMDDTEASDDGDDANDDGKVKAAIGAVRAKMQQCGARTFGEFLAMVRTERVHPITTPDRRRSNDRHGPRQWRDPVRNRAGRYEHCADRAMIREEFAKLWDKQKDLAADDPASPLGPVLTDVLRRELDDESGDSVWKHKGLLFGQRRATWDLGTLGRCVLEPTERCAPHADMYASRYLVVETVNNLKISQRGQAERPLTPEERAKINRYLSGPLGVQTRGKQKGQPKRTASVSDLRDLMGWGRAGKTAEFRLNIENDEDRTINTDWFAREIIHGAITPDMWDRLSAAAREGLNRLLLRYDPDDEKAAPRLKADVMQDWAGLNDAQADALVLAWKRRPRPDAKRLNMSRRAVRNLLAVMNRDEPWPDPKSPTGYRWLTQIEARKLIAEDADFRDQTTAGPLSEQARRRYATGAKGSTARDRHYMRKHILKKAGEPVYGPDGLPLHEPPPAPLISNPVVRKAIHEVRRHLIEYMTTFGRKPDQVQVELSREARMGKRDADALLFRNRLRNRIRKDIIAAFDLDSLTSTQQRAAIDRVILCVQQAGRCPICGQAGLTERLAATGQGCEVAHILPRASGGHNGLRNLVLAHDKCNRDMARRTPRQYWTSPHGPKGGFDEAIARVEHIYSHVERPRAKEMKTATGNVLWLCYFDWRDDRAKVEQFRKDITDIQDMTARQDAATKYATRQVMAYLADALYDGDGLPERGGDRRIFATDGLWTSRLRREWGLFFDPHEAKAHGLTSGVESERKEKNRGDHRHHAVDAVVIALCTRQVQSAWEDREKRADAEGINTADEEATDNYRRRNPLPPPAPLHSREELREAVRRTVYGDGQAPRPICHRPAKRKLIGALHEETLFGPVLDGKGQLTANYTAKKSVLTLDPNHLRMPEGWDELAAKLAPKLADARLSPRQRRGIRAELNALKDPPPGKSGIVRDRELRNRIRQCLCAEGIDPDRFTAQQIKGLCPPGDPNGYRLRMPSGAPIRSVVLLRTMTDPIVLDRKRPDHATSRMLPDPNPASRRAYVGGNNHHIEIRAAADKKGRERWSGTIVTAHEAAQRKLARLRALRAAGLPASGDLRKMLADQRAALRPRLRAIEQSYPIVDRRDNADGRFVMSLCEGETLHMKDKHSGEVGYFVVAKLDKPQAIVLVPHWDARKATERKDAEGRKVPDSRREQFTVTPTDLMELAPPGRPHAVKVRVSPLGVVRELARD